ncbi:MAG: hypothetical protein MJZ92_01780 [Paludibacteraceae bacterium]|nr:hypothetical protein [Paludibacteraceae bacterium]
MKTKTIMRILLAVAVVVMAYFCITSVVTPIKFEEKRAQREVAVIKNLVSIRTAEAEFRAINGRYTANADSLLMFLKTTPKKEVMKEGSLTDKQLEAGLTEHKAVKIMQNAKKKALSMKNLSFENDSALYAYIWENDKEVKSNGLSGFRRDTIIKNMIETLYKGEYTVETIDQIMLIPYTDNQRFELEVNDTYTTSQGIRVPLFEARAHYNTYLADLDDQERVNLIDKEEKLEHYPGLKIGDITSPNNNAGNWE